MAFQFPPNPSAGDQVEGPNGFTYEWNGTGWITLGGGGGGGGGWPAQGVTDASEAQPGEVGEVLILEPPNNWAQIPLNEIQNLTPVTLPPGDWDINFIVELNVNRTIVFDWGQWRLFPTPFDSVPTAYRNAFIIKTGPLPHASDAVIGPVHRCLSAVPVEFTLGVGCYGTAGTQNYVQHVWYLYARRRR